MNALMCEIKKGEFAGENRINIEKYLRVKN